MSRLVSCDPAAPMRPMSPERLDADTLSDFVQTCSEPGYGEGHGVDDWESMPKAAMTGAATDFSALVEKHGEFIDDSIRASTLRDDLGIPDHLILRHFDPALFAPADWQGMVVGTVFSALRDDLRAAVIGELGAELVTGPLDSAFAADPTASHPDNNQDHAAMLDNPAPPPTPSSETISGDFLPGVDPAMLPSIVVERTVLADAATEKSAGVTASCANGTLELRCGTESNESSQGIDYVDACFDGEMPPFVVNGPHLVSALESLPGDTVMFSHIQAPPQFNTTGGVSLRLLDITIPSTDAHHVMVALMHG